MDPRLEVSTAKALIESTAKCVPSAWSRATPGGEGPRAGQSRQGIARLVSRSDSDEGRTAPDSELVNHIHPQRDGVLEQTGSAFDHGTEEVLRWARFRHARFVIEAPRSNPRGAYVRA